MKQAVISLEGITKTYVNGKLVVPVLHGIDLNIYEGEFTSIMGPSGSGKSTFMNILGCLDRPTSGSYKLDGEEVATLSDDELAFVRNKRIGFVFQSFNLLPKLTAQDNVALPMVYAGVPKKERNERAAYLLDSLGLGDRLDHLPSELSGGQRQRVAIARALANDPSIIMADEPTGNLDSKSSVDVMNIFTNLYNEGRTIILVTHEPDIATYASRNIVLRDGYIVEDKQNPNMAGKMTVTSVQSTPPAESVQSAELVQSAKTVQPAPTSTETVVVSEATSQKATKPAEGGKEGRLMYKEGFLMAWASLVANKMRSLLTMLGIIIGVAAVIALVSIGYGVRSQIQDSISSLGSNLLMVYPGAPRTPGVRPTADSQKTLKLEDFTTISHLQDVDMASPVSAGNSYVVIYTNKNWTTSVNGVNNDFQYINNWTVKSGRFITASQVERRERVVVIGSTVATNLFGTEDPVGKDIRIKNNPYKVIGVLESKGSGSFGNDQDDVIYIPYTTGMERLQGVNYLRMIYIKAKDGVDLNRLQTDVENILRVRHNIKNPELDDFNVRNMATIMATVEETTATMTLFLGAVAAISLVVGGIGIMNIMLVSVTERTREIGVRKALGATYRVIVMQFLIEAVVISLVGGAIGILVGIGASKLIGALTSMKTVISMGPILLSFGFSMAIGLIFGLYPARKAAKLNPIDALHYE